MEKFSRALRLRWLWFSWEGAGRPWQGLELPVDNHDLALFNAATTVILGNGEKATFWTSRWLHGEALATLYPALFRHSKRKNRTVKDAITGDKWVLDVDHNMTVQLIEEFLSLWTRLQGVTLMPQHEDKIIWMHTVDCNYTASSAYKIQFAGMVTSMAATTIWKAKAPPRCRFFTWLMLQNRIWTAARLLIREWPNQYFCPLCMRNLETTSHLFTECQYSLAIWEKAGHWLRVDGLLPGNWVDSHELSAWFVGLGNCGQRSKRDGLRSMVMLIVWEIWKERNRRIFNNAARPTDLLISAIQDEARTWIRAGNKGLELVMPSAGIMSQHVDDPSVV
jgi:hypothetical protein